MKGKIDLYYKSKAHRDRAYELMTQQGLQRWIECRGEDAITVTQPPASTLLIPMHPTEIGDGFMGIAI